MVVHTARAESRVKCNAPSLPPLLCFAQPAGRRANWFGLVLVGHSGYMETNPNPTQPSHIILFFGQLDKLGSDFVPTEMLKG